MSRDMILYGSYREMKFHNEFWVLFSAIAGAAAGPFTVHFWAPMSKWLISGASFLDLNRPTELISITQVCLFFCIFSVLLFHSLD